MKETEKIGLITDFDNTLVDQMGFFLDHLHKTCEILEIKPPDQKDLLHTLKENLPFEKIFEKLFNEKAANVLTKYRETAMETPYKPTEGSLEVVKILNQRGVPIIIVSNRTNKLTERLAQAGYNQESFLTISQPPLEDLKPSKKAYLDAIDVLIKNGITKENIYIIGDSLDDYQACPNELTQNFFAVLTGPNTKEDFLAINIDTRHILSNISLLPDFI